ncbi:MAG: YggS family pyridoxal phosphate-dependent enzyme [Elusimicrobia bacterium]|nr:YggS family pyridoxal phosphate-dependent enzyme [Elusimicrobiota bacterium]
MVISDNLNQIREKIAKSAQKTGRKVDEITLVAVTKTVEIDKIEELIGLGVKNIGENRIQSATTKFEALSSASKTDCLPLNTSWHMIGHLQSNKAKKAVELFDFIQSVDSPNLAKEINKQAQKLKKNIKCLIEIKVSEEPSKFGIFEDNIKALLDIIPELKNVVFCGIMTMAPFFEDPEKARPYFNKAKRTMDDIKHLLNEPYSKTPILSMGMSNDFEAAIEEGSNMVRIGTALYK